MAKAATKASVLTTLVIGRVRVPVGLFATVAKPDKTQEFDTAGPHGGVLKARPVARPVPVDVPRDAPSVPVRSNPLATEGDARSRGFVDDGPSFVPAGAMVDGEYGRELVEEGTGAIVMPQDVRRGVRRADGRFIDCTEQLQQIDERTRLDQIEVLGFVDATRIPRVRVKGAQYLGAGDEQAPRALRIIFEGLKRKRRMALVRLTKRTRQTLGVIGVAGGALVVLELVWAEDVREAPERVTRIAQEQVTEREVAVFEELIEARALSARAVDELRDEALELREHLKAQALAGEITEVMAAPAPVADDLMAQLEASLAGAVA